MDNKKLWENKQWLKNILAKSGTDIKIENEKGLCEKNKLYLKYFKKNLKKN